MNPRADFDNQIARLRRRVRLLLIERYCLFGAGAGAAVAVVLVLLSQRYDELINYTLWAGVVVLGAIAGIGVGCLTKLDDLTLATAADLRTGLKERLSTAVTLPRSGEVGDWEQALLSDANERVSHLKSSEVFRHRFGVPHLAAGIALLVLLAVVVIPQFPALQSHQRRQETAVMKQEGVKLAKIAKELDQQTSREHADLKKLANALNRLAWKMQTGRMAKKQAMLETQRITKDIQKAQDQLAKQNSTPSSDQAQREMRAAGEKLARSMAEKIAQRDKIPLSEAMKKMATDKRLMELARKQGPLSSSEQHELEQRLDQYAKAGSQLSIPPQLGEALAKLAQNKDYQKMMELMQKLADKAGSGKMSKTDQEALQKQLEQLAKAGLSPEQLKKMLAQLKEMQKMGKLLAKAGAG